MHVIGSFRTVGGVHCPIVSSCAAVPYFCAVIAFARCRQEHGSQVVRPDEVILVRGEPPCVGGGLVLQVATGEEDNLAG